MNNEDEINRFEEELEETDVLLRIVMIADKLGHSSVEGDISERSREILATDFPDYLMRKMRRNFPDDTNKK